LRTKKIRVLFFGRLRDVVGTNEIVASDIKDIEELEKIFV
jgi:molybdopterin converting factor small subunit